ncbi:hypothetical protein O0L34_g3957 [Tuta absoluta]|nr:hypothetical protein O0L34_g3957 [Tuta absoluta]
MAVQKGEVLQAAWWMLVTASAVSAGIACLSNPCLHGICIDDVNTTYSCYCVDGYTGVQCQTNWDECWSEPCQNGGTCVDGIASYNCSCPDGFIGDNCETNYNECESNPCTNNGTCIDMANGYVCSCVPGFSGEHCEVDVAVCNATEEVRCYNGGQCIEGPGFKFYCKCAAGWTGSKCVDQIDECQSMPCQNGGFCIDAHADYMCACAYGYTGKDCEVQIEFCNEDSCSDNAICVLEEGMRVCYCVPDYHGERCELQYDECLLGPRCMNGGSCIDGVDNFTCSCPPQLTGLLCECLILDDGSHDCEYIRPTPYPDISSTAITLVDDFTTTEAVSYVPGFNGTTFKTTRKDETESWTATTFTELITTTESGSEDITEQSVIVTDTEETNAPKTTTSKIEITESTETVTSERATIESGDSKVETTTECKESCEKSTEFTAKLPPVDVETTTSMVTDGFKTSTEDTRETTLATLPPIIDTGSTTSKSRISTTQSISTISTAIENTTPKIDTTTEKMFTDTPTDHAVTDLPFPSTIPEMPDTTTVSPGIDNTTTGYTTLQSECTDSICNNRGTCINTPHGITCQCIFNYGGRFCDDKKTITSAAFGGNTYVTHTVRNTTSIAIEFKAKTLITDGQIMEVDIAKGVYMKLFMNSGLLKFKFSCGYQTMLLGEINTFVNKGYPMKIETRLDLFVNEQHCNATLRLNDTVAMSGGQVANISVLDDNTTIHLGNKPNTQDSESKLFIGCITDLVINGEKREIFGDAKDAASVSECSSLSCLSGPCHNGGTCRDAGEEYVCSCANGWLGTYCNQSICENNPCKSGGSCVPHPGSGFLCLCPYGKHGIFCEYNVDITRPSFSPIISGISSYLIFPLNPSAMNSDRFDLRLRFQTPDMDQIALLAFVGQSGRHDSRSPHLALTFVKGYIMLTWNMGSGPRRIFTSRALTPRRGGHTVRVWRRGRTGGLSVDSRHNVSGNAPSGDTKINLLPYIYIGGHPSENFYDLPHDLPLHSGWKGCIWEVSGQAIGSGKAIGGRGVGQCGVAQCTSKSCNAPRGVCIHSPATYGCICNEGWFGPTCSAKKSPCDQLVTKCQGRCVITADIAQCDCPYGKTGVNCDQDLIPTDVLFTGVRSYVKLQSHPISSVSLSLEAEVKPQKERGLVLFTQTPHFYTSLSLQGGMLEFRWTDHLSGLTSLVRSGVVLTTSHWHKVKAGRYGSRLYVWADGALSTESMLAHAYPHTHANATILVGGAKDLASLPFDVMSGPPESFTGCIRNLNINNVLVPLEKHNIQEGENLGDCDGTPCGSETCGGGACVVEGGRARCACALSTERTSAGARCRRHVDCTPANCRAPSGVCRHGACVCAAGFAGDSCEHKINVTIPQFNGEALLSVWRAPSLGHAGKQRLGAMTTPSYIALNFTTAQPTGLLLWADMGMEYIGIGIENGYLKMVWYFHQDNSTIEVFNTRTPKFETSRFLSRLLPHAGFIADAEWHTVELRFRRRNITVTVDGLLAYVEEPGLMPEPDYGVDIDLFIGGITEEDSAIAKRIFPNNFKGCIDNISTEEDSYITNYMEVYSENVKSCQLFP